VLNLRQLSSFGQRIDASVPEHQRVVESIRAWDERERFQAIRDHLAPKRLLALEPLLVSPQLRSINLGSA
jgi:DNA-binding FadR family transcriptional regulator